MARYVIDGAGGESQEFAAENPDEAREVARRIALEEFETSRYEVWDLDHDVHVGTFVLEEPRA